MPLVVSILVHGVIYISYQNLKCYRWGLSHQVLAKMMPKSSITLPKLLQVRSSHWFLPSPAVNNGISPALMITLNPVLEVANTATALQPEKRERLPALPSQPRKAGIAAQTQPKQILEKPAVPQSQPKSLSLVMPADKAPAPKPIEKATKVFQPVVMPMPEVTEQAAQVNQEAVRSHESTRSEAKPENAARIIQPGYPDSEVPAQPIAQGRSEPISSAAAGTPGSADAKSSNRSANLVRPPNLANFYPYHARAKEITGTTCVRLDLDQHGRVVEAKIAGSQPVGVFDAAALRMARTLKFQPACENGKPVASEFTITIEWKLKP